MSDNVAAILLTAILSPLVCLVLYLFWKGHREVKKIMRRNEVVATINEDWEAKRAISGMILENIKTDYLFKEAIISLVTEQLQKDWKLEKAVTTIARRTTSGT